MLHAIGATKERLVTMNARPVSMTPARFKAFYVEEARKWTELTRKAGITPQPSRCPQRQRLP